jgi:hypothetical protein
MEMPNLPSDHCPNCGFRLTSIEEVNPRKCRTCGKVKEADEFYHTVKRGKPFIYGTCKACLKEKRCKGT